MRARQLRADRVRHARAHAARRAGVEERALHVAGQHLARDAHDRLAVDREARVPRQHVAQLAAQAVRIDRHVIGVERLRQRRLVLARLGGELLRPGAVGAAQRASCERRQQRFGRDARIGHDAELEVRTAPQLLGGHVDLRHARALGEAAGRAEAEDPVEAAADHQHHVGVGERLAAGAVGEARVVVGDGAARHRRADVGDAEVGSRRARRPRRTGGALATAAAGARLRQQRGQLVDRLLIRVGQAPARRRAHARALSSILRDTINRQVEVHRAGSRLRLADREVHPIGIRSFESTCCVHLRRDARAPSVALQAASPRVGPRWSPSHHQRHRLRWRRASA